MERKISNQQIDQGDRKRELLYSTSSCHQLPSSLILNHPTITLSCALIYETLMEIVIRHDYTSKNNILIYHLNKCRYYI